MSAEGRKGTIANYSGVSLSKQDVTMLLDNKEDILEQVDNIVNGMPIELAYVQLIGTLRVTFDDRFNTVSIRNWYENDHKQMRASPKGVSVSPDEMNAILDVLPELYPFMHDL